MRGIIETLIEYRNPFSILTKGALIVRDLELLTRGGEGDGRRYGISVGTLDEDVWARASPGHLIRASDSGGRRAERGGIPRGMLAPILPGISDQPDQLRAVVEGAIAAGATHVSPICSTFARG